MLEKIPRSISAIDQHLDNLRKTHPQSVLDAEIVCILNSIDNRSDNYLAEENWASIAGIMEQGLINSTRNDIRDKYQNHDCTPEELRVFIEAMSLFETTGVKFMKGYSDVMNYRKNAEEEIQKQ